MYNIREKKKERKEGQTKPKHYTLWVNFSYNFFVVESKKRYTGSYRQFNKEIKIKIM